MARKLDIFAVLKSIDSGNYFLYDQLTDEERKEVAPFVIQRWLTGTSDREQILRVNSLVNTFAFALGKHPALLTKLMSVAATKRVKRYQWQKGLSTGSSKSKIIEIISKYYDCSSKDASQMVSLLSAEDIMAIAVELGLDKDEIKDLRKQI